MREDIRKIITAITEVLETEMGDTEPQLDNDWTDDEIRNEYPVFWALCKFNALEKLLEGIE